MNNTDRHPECHMRTALGNCNPIGGFCTSVNESICEALHKVSRPQGKWLFKEITDDYHVIGQCSICKERRRVDNFCPNCGAKMKGVDDE